MKKIFLTITVFLASIINIEAQMLRELVVEPVQERATAVYLESCDSPSLGVLVFRTAIPDLNIAISPPSRLINTNHNSLRNEYVLCLQPTDQRTRITITHREFEAYVFFVDDIIASQAQIFRVNPRETGAVSIAARDANSLGTIRMNEGDYADAESFFSSAVEQERDNAEFLFNLGRVRYRLGNYAGAVSALQSAAGIRPMNAEIHHMLGSSFFGSERFEDAVGSFRQAVDLEPANVRYREDLHRAMSAVANPPAANFDMGRHYLGQNNFTQALNYFREAARLQPTNTEFQRYVNSTEILQGQDQHMSAAAEAFRRAQSAVRPVGGRTVSVANVDPQLERYIHLFRIPLNYVASARALGPLSLEMQESADFYEFEYLFQRYRADLLSRRELRDFWGEHSENPLISRPPPRRVFRPSVGVGIGGSGLWAMSGAVGLRVFDTEQLVNIHVGIQYTGYFADFYRTPEGGTKPEGDALDPWRVGAHQISFPATLQLNVFRSRHGMPWAVFAAATVQYNYNISGRVRFISDTGNSEFVNRTGISTVFSVGYTTNRWSAGLYFRQDDGYLFNREEIMRNSTSLPPNSNENRFNRIMDHRFMIGGRLSLFF